MDCLWTFEQTLALPEEEIFVSLTRAGAWSWLGNDGWTSSQALGFVCPTCCKIWGVLSCQEQELYFITRHCSIHATSKGEKPVDGSILYDYSVIEHGNFDLPLLAVLPQQLLAREVKLHLQHFERNL